MRVLKYELADGTIVTTMKEAQTSGQGYTVHMENVSERDSALSPVRKAMIKQFGFVSSVFKNKVII